MVYLYSYIWLKFMVNVGKYTSLMDPMGGLIHMEFLKMTSLLLGLTPGIS